MNVLKQISLLALVVGTIVFGATTATAHADVNNFRIANYDITYDLDRDAEQRSTLTTTEKIVAQFPQVDQNHGIERAITKDYKGHPTKIDIQSVTDQSGKELEYKTRNKGSFTVVRIGDPDTYVRGQQTYVIKYTQRDVTAYFSNLDVDEFYWDTNGTGWKQPIDKLSVTLTMSGALSGRFNGNGVCYQGSEGSTKQCELLSDGNSFSVNATNLKAGENVSLAIGFKPSTFAAYQATRGDIVIAVWKRVQLILLPLSIIAFIYLCVRSYRQSNRSREQHTIIPEYLPPKDSSVATASKLLGKQPPFAAQLVDLAVRKYVKIYETTEKSFFGSKKHNYSLEILKPIDDLRDEEKEFMNDLFRKKPTVGTKLDMKDLKKDTGAWSRFSDNVPKLQKLEKEKYQLRAPNTNVSRWFTRFGFVSLIFSTLLFSPSLLVVAFIAFGIGWLIMPLTDKGLAQIRYLKGLKMYIGTAEQERLKMLQSAEGAEKSGIDTSNDAELVKLYERNLPYAMIFGQEKSWNKQLGEYYEKTGLRPDWYVGAAGYRAFNAASFSSAMNSFSSSAASSSPSGGSGGGGSSGGGGGGGGGGGW